MAGSPSAAQDFSTLVGTVGDLFGTSQSSKGVTNTTGTAESITNASQSNLRSEQLNLDPEAIQQIIRDVLGGADGLASIFQGEQSAGIFNSSVAAQAAGDLASKLVGEIAKITGENVTSEDQNATSKTTQTKEEKTVNTVTAKDEGVLSGIGDFLGF